ncbi:MAG: type II toxin-antitoxin system VapC family toxin [Thermodesulfobacteriota bacterium]|nr:type II toxin-antitoxin system VapC family toxin [Thermodesulfobacteriota bacterium]
MRKVLIDTNIYSLAMRGDHSVTRVLQQVDRIGVSAISLGELLSGFRGGNAESRNREELNQFLDSPRVVIFPVDMETGDFYAEIRNALKAAGTPIPTNDIWIAATAFQNGYKLFSNDRHFSYVSGLVCIKPDAEGPC